jgi:hypothetical protein
MKHLLLMPMYIFFFIIILAFMAQPSHASEPFITFDNAPLTRDEMMIKRQVDKHRQKAPAPRREAQEQAFEIKVQGKCVHGCVRPLDGDLPAIEISSARTGMPSEYLDTRQVDAIAARKQQELKEYAARR